VAVIVAVGVAVAVRVAVCVAVEVGVRVGLSVGVAVGGDGQQISSAIPRGLDTLVFLPLIIVEGATLPFAPAG